MLVLSTLICAVQRLREWPDALAALQREKPLNTVQLLSQVPSSSGNTNTTVSAAWPHYVIKFTMFGHMDPVIK